MQRWHRAIVTVLEPLDKEEATIQREPPPSDWRRHVGILTDSPHFNGHPVAIQQAMRDEWG
ncbi:MAG: DUF2281 domain-containing protein [Magnetococcales bacterium]|nr:DUF2281 domain-containing protein [Magnetococcales bacterium]